MQRLRIGDPIMCSGIPREAGSRRSRAYLHPRTMRLPFAVRSSGQALWAVGLELLMPPIRCAVEDMTWHLARPTVQGNPKLVLNLVKYCLAIQVRYVLKRQ